LKAQEWCNMVVARCHWWHESHDNM
jgi:hypothetical protein